MIPVELTIQGLYSYQEKQTIDFTRLTASRLFGIFGPVGCGKSSILEAITFALYGQTERLNKADNRNYNMMNLKSDILLIDFIFQTDTESEKLYRFTVKGKRSRDSSVKSFNRSGYCKKNGDWEPIPDENATNILNLTYEDFRRTVIIPQGRFREFLELGNADRTDMLKRIFRLEQFELGDKVKRLKDAAKTSIDIASARLAEVASATQERIDEIETSAKSLAYEISVLKSEIEKKESDLKNYAFLKDLFQKLEQKAKDTAELEEILPIYTLKEKSLQEYQECLIKFKPAFDRADEIAQEVVMLDKEVTLCLDEIRSMNYRLAESETRFEEIKKQYENRSQLENRLRELNILKEVLAADAEIAQLETRIEKGSKAVSDQNLTIRQIKDAKTSIIDMIRDIGAGLEQLSYIHEVASWFSEKNNIKKQFEKTKSDYEKAVLTLEKYEAEKLMLLSDKGKGLFSNGESMLPDDEMIKYLEKTKLSCNNELGSIRERIELIGKQKSLQEYASELEDGKPCPLCGSFNHPSPLSGHDIGLEYEEASVSAINMEAIIKLCDDMINRINIYRASTNPIKEQIEGFEKELSGHSSALEQLVRSFVWNGYHYDDEKKVQEDILKKAGLEQQLRALNREREDIDKKLEEKLNERESWQAKLMDLMKSRDELKARNQAQLSGFGSVSDLECSLFDSRTVEIEINKLRSEIEAVLSEFQTAEPALKKLREVCSLLSGKKEQLEKQLRIKSDALNQINLDINQLIEESAFNDRLEIKNKLAQNINIEYERRSITEYYENLKAEQAQLETLRAEVSGKAYDPGAHEKLVFDLTNDKETLANLNERSGALQKELDDTRLKVEKKATITKELESLELRMKNLETLTSLFRGSGFVSYVSTRYLRNLVSAANERFMKLTSNQFRLELKESDNTFEVCDHLNGGRMRHIKTLSGGQTFQASLSLALALSENISLFNKSLLNFFFLDEGFGTLDKESLHTVFDTLKSLRKDNRIVGVISHVEELRQEIESHISATLDPERGSIISTSWE